MSTPGTIVFNKPPTKEELVAMTAGQDSALQKLPLRIRENISRLLMEAFTPTPIPDINQATIKLRATNQDLAQRLEDAGFAIQISEPYYTATEYHSGQGGQTKVPESQAAAWQRKCDEEEAIRESGGIISPGTPRVDTDYKHRDISIDISQENFFDTLIDAVAKKRLNPDALLGYKSSFSVAADAQTLLEQALKAQVESELLTLDIAMPRVQKMAL